MEMIIRTQRLSKEYNKIFRVKDIDLRVPQGAVYGFGVLMELENLPLLKCFLDLLNPHKEILIF